MRSAVLRAPREVAIEGREVPEPGPGEVRVRLEGAGICASELPVWEGRDWFEYPRAPGTPGHEGWGTVDALGPEVGGLAVGQRVAVISERAHAEFDIAPASATVPLPDEIPAGMPFPGEPFACAMNAVRRAAVRPGERVAVLGAGFQALAIIQLLAGTAGEIAVVSRRYGALTHAGAAGAGTLWCTGERAIEAADGTFDVVFECTGHQEPLDAAARLTRIRGRLVIVGFHQDGRRTIDLQLWNWRGLDVINAHERDPEIYADGLRRAVGAVLDGRLHPDTLITHEFTFDELGSAYAAAAAGGDGFVKAVWRRG
jgi:threonine dehydrogenase-like Zn-dependent dehydrogenase